MFRRIAAGAIALSLIGGLVYQADQRSEVQETMDLVRRLDAWADAIPEEKVLTSRTAMIATAIEILPYMAYERLTPVRAVQPADLVLFFQMDAKAFHVLGTASCRSTIGVIGMNGRVTNPASAWYGREGTLTTLVHELIHIQRGPFCNGSSEFVEGNTQVATAEVLAAMVNHGNEDALRPLLLHLRSMALGSLQYQLERDAFVSFYTSIEDDPFRIAAMHKSYRFWTYSRAGEEELAYILKRYSYLPWQALMEGVEAGEAEAIKVGFAGPIDMRTGEHIIHYRPLPLDDLRYFLAELLPEVKA